MTCSRSDNGHWETEVIIDEKYWHVLSHRNRGVRRRRHLYYLLSDFGRTDNCV